MCFVQVFIFFRQLKSRIQTQTLCQLPNTGADLSYLFMFQYYLFLLSKLGIDHRSWRKWQLETPAEVF